MSNLRGSHYHWFLVYPCSDNSVYKYTGVGLLLYIKVYSYMYYNCKTTFAHPRMFTYIFYINGCITIPIISNLFNYLGKTPCQYVCMRVYLPPPLHSIPFLHYTLLSTCSSSLVLLCIPCLCSKQHNEKFCWHRRTIPLWVRSGPENIAKE